MMESPTRKRSHSEERFLASSERTEIPPRIDFNDVEYRWEVRRIPASTSESDLDSELHRAALQDGIELPTKLQEVTTPNEAKAINSSMSGVTVTSDTTNIQSSIMSQSTAPTSCSSSERRTPTRNSDLSGTIAAPDTARLFSPSSSKKNSAFRARMRKMVRLGKKGQSSGEWRHSYPDVTALFSPVYSDVQLHAEDIKRAPSVRSHRSDWSNEALPVARQKEEVDPSALKRSLECKEMAQRQNEQTQERDRFIAYRKAMLDQLHEERLGVKDQKRNVHEAVLQEKRVQDQRIIEALENKHLAEELRMSEEHNLREKMMKSRLRRIEHFVHHPTPPPTTVNTDELTERSSTDSDTSPLRPRTVGPADFNHLAEQYREQKNLVQVNVARINVLRGQQQKKLDILMEQKAKETDALEEAQCKQMASVDEEFDDREKALVGIFKAKQELLELYWWQCAFYEQEKQQRSTGVEFQPLPPVTVESTTLTT